MADEATTTFRVLEDVAAERARQRARYGAQALPDGTGGTFRAAGRRLSQRRCDRATAAGRVTWAHVLEEEVSEVLAETDAELLRAELVQVAAVAVQWIEALDRRRRRG
jgi:hypothetical protein